MAPLNYFVRLAAMQRRELRHKLLLEFALLVFRLIAEILRFHQPHMVEVVHVIFALVRRSVERLLVAVFDGIGVVASHLAIRVHDQE